MGGGGPEGASRGGATSMLGYLLASKVRGLTIGFAAYGYSLYLFLTWLPAYLERELHMSLLKSAGYIQIPRIVAIITDAVVGGWLIDHLISRDYDETRVRKTVLVLGMPTGLAVFAANAVRWILWIPIALGALAASVPVGWSIPSLIAPNGGMGGGATAATGCIVSLTGSVSGAFLLAGVALLTGIFAYVVLLGEIAPLPDRKPSLAPDIAGAH